MIVILIILLGWIILGPVLATLFAIGLGRTQAIEKARWINECAHHDFIAIGVDADDGTIYHCPSCDDVWNAGVE